MGFYLYSIFILPIVVIIINVLIYPVNKIPKNYIAWFFSLSAFLMLIFSCVVFFGYEESPTNELFNYTFFTVDNFIINFSIYFNPLTAVMLFVVCFVSFLVHIFSLGYMKKSEYHRYYIYLHLFTWAMLGLVLAGNIIQMFVFWELVGLCSYLLIGFWYEKKSATDAAKKAFIITRVGDFGFMIGILYLISNLSNITTSSLASDLLSVNTLIEVLPGSEFALIFSLGILFGAMGKSAQFPLHTWLPDAMEGPTPVSALIHAATMVAAGVFLIGRFLPIFPEEVLIITALIGAITAFGAALLGTVMNDVKKVLAYSTISQLGYMVMALGIGMSLYTAAFFHLFTHAFFKALLFLVAGSLSHSVGTFDMKKMGGLRKLMPWTYLFFIIGTFSLIGLFPFSGFWSKDEILAQISHEHTAIANVVYYLGSAAVFLTSFYMFRALFMIFAGKYDNRKNPGVSVHESGLILLIPMAILAVASIFFGFIFNSTIDLGIIESHWFNKFIKPDYHSHAFDFNVAIISHILVILGFMSAYIQYRYMKSYKSKLIVVIQNVLLQKYYLDIFYEKIVVKNIMYKNIIGLLNYIDTKFIDGTWDRIAITTKTISSRLSFIQNGQLQFYSFGIPLGIIIMSFLVILWR